MTSSPQAGPRRYQLAELQGHVGQEIGLSDWLSVEQPRIDGFADATGDRQWIHIDPARAAQGPFGTTIAHGYLTLSLLPVLLDSALVIEDARMGVNYGLNKVRFTAPVPAGSRLRARFVLAEYRRLPGGGAQLTTDVTYELESGGKSPCVVQSIARFFT
jgi:acyl dehydratase